MPERSALLGRVLGTEDATPVAFWFVVQPGRKVRLDDVVMVRTADPTEPDPGVAGEAGGGQPTLPGGRGVTFYGVVDQVRRRHEGLQFEGDTNLVAEGLMPAAESYAAHVLVTRLEPEEFLPPAPGDPVLAATGEALERALYVDGMSARLGAGLLRSGDPAYLNLDFVDGTRGAHVNISGISGVATKTSYALFLLYSLFHDRSGRDGKPLLKDPGSARAVVFNVKGEDLLFIDQPNRRVAEEEAQWMSRNGASKGRYEALGLHAGPFESCGLHAPPQATPGGTLVADVQQRDGVSPFVWTLRQFCLERMLPFAFADVSSMSQLEFLLQHVEERLHQLARTQGGAAAALEVPERLPGDDASRRARAEKSAQRIDEAEGLTFEALGAASASGSGQKLTTFAELVDYLQFKLLDEGADDGDVERGGERSGGDPGWTARQSRGTREAFIRRLRGAQKHLSRLIRGDLGARALEAARLDVLGSQKQVHVIDIHQLAPLAQMFVVGVTLRGLFAAKEAGHRGKLFVVLDELNKYAPAEGSSPIKDVLLDIAERGRSLGVILIGAQQTASEVERRIVGNAAVRVAGRLDAAEAERPEYRFMPASTRARTTILAPGTMILHQPDVPTPVLVTFPFPAWATRAEERDTRVSDEEAGGLLL